MRSRQCFWPIVRCRISRRFAWSESDRRHWHQHAEEIIAEIKLLEHIFTLPDKRPLRMSDWKAANQKHDETYANNPWFRLWKRDGVSAPSGYKP